MAFDLLHTHMHMFRSPGWRERVIHSVEVKSHSGLKADDLLQEVRHLRAPPGRGHKCQAQQAGTN